MTPPCEVVLLTFNKEGNCFLTEGISYLKASIFIVYMRKLKNKKGPKNDSTNHQSFTRILARNVGKP